MCHARGTHERIFQAFKLLLLATQFILFGLWYSLRVYISNLVLMMWISRARKYGLRNSLSRQSMSVIVIIMLVSCTAIVILNLEFYIVQLPAIGLDTPPDVAQKLILSNISQTWLAGLNVGFPLQIYAVLLVKLYLVFSK